MDVFDFFVVFLDGPQGSAKEASLPQFAPLGAPAVDEDGRAVFEGFHDPREGERKDGRADGVPGL